MESVYKRHQSFFGEPYLLTSEQQRNPISVFISFFDSMHLYQVREYLEALKEAALIANTEEVSSCRGREDVIYFFKLFEEFIEAGFVIARQDAITWKEKS